MRRLLLGLALAALAAETAYIAHRLHADPDPQEPPMTSHAQLRLGPKPRKQSIIINGHDIGGAVQCLSVHHMPGYMPVIQLDLLIPEVDIDGQAQVVIPPSTHAALTDLGWTPPEEG